MKSIICFAAHPDDLEFSCTGTLKKHFMDDYEIHFVILTNGENGFKAGEMEREERVRIRQQEQREAGKMLGVNEVVFFDNRDGFLEYTEKLRADVVALIKKIRPEIIFSFDPANNSYDDINLFHRDHRVAAQVVFDACFAAKNFWMYPGESHRVSRVYFYGCKEPDHVVDISDVIDFKLSMLACHKSQFPDFSRVEKLIREKISPPHGSYAHAETFRILEIEQRT